MRLEFLGPSKRYELEVEGRDDEIEITMDRKKIRAEIQPADGENDYIAKVDRKIMLVHLEEETESSITLTLQGETIMFTRPRTAAAVIESSVPKQIQVEERVLQSPMPGRIISVPAKVGMHVEVGTTVIVMESMKMESVILSDRNGRIGQVFVKKGDVVSRGQVLLRFR